MRSATIAFGAAGNSAEFLAEGWGHGEDGFTWTVGRVASLHVGPPLDRGGMVLRCAVRPHVRPPMLQAQRIGLEVNGVVVTELTLTEDAVVDLVIPKEVIDRHWPATVAFRLPDATAPARLGGSHDTRELGLAVRTIEIRPLEAGSRGSGSVGAGVERPGSGNSLINLVYMDDAFISDGVPANFKNIRPYVQTSPFVRCVEFSAMREHFCHRSLSALGSDPGYLPIALFGNPDNWLGRDGSVSLDALGDLLPKILKDHPRLRILLDYSWESAHGAKIFELLDDFVAMLRVEPSRVTFLVSNSRIGERLGRYRAENPGKAGYTIVGDDYFLPYSAVEFARHRWPMAPPRLVSSLDVDRLRGQRRPFKLLSFNRRPRWHRFMLALMLCHLGMRESAIISMPSLRYEGDWHPESEELDRYGALLPAPLWEALCRNRNTVFAELPWIIDQNMDRSGHTSQFAYGAQNTASYLNSYVHVVTESYFESSWSDMFITEKTCKAIVGLQPFMIFGHHGSLRALERHGLTRPRHLPDDYDDVFDIGERLTRLYSGLARINEWSLSDLHEIYYDNLPVSLHNREVLMSSPLAFRSRIVEALSAPF